MDKLKSVRHTAQELKQYFLDNAEPLVKQYIDAALGSGTLASTNAGAREEVWSVLKTLMLQSSDKLDIEIKSAQDILDAVSSGKCTFEEAEKLLGLYEKMKKISTMDSVGALGNGTGGLTINILGGQPVVSATKVIDHED